MFWYSDGEGEGGGGGSIYSGCEIVAIVYHGGDGDCDGDCDGDGKGYGHDLSGDGGGAAVTCLLIMRCP